MEINNNNNSLIDKALSNMRGRARIVREWCGYIILAQNEMDYQKKCGKISSGDTNGFYSIKRAAEYNDII
jgi:hypothetical protein